MRDMKASVVIDLAGNLTRRAQQYSQSLGRMAKTGSRHLTSLNRSMVKVGRGMEAMGNRYTAMASGVATGVVVRDMVQLEERLIRMGIQAGKSAEEIDRIKSAVFDAAQMDDVRVDPAQILTAIDAIVEKTGDLDFADKNIRNIGLAIQATGAQGGAIGEVLAEFQKMGITAPGEVMKALDVMNVQGKEGAFTLENLASLGPRVINAYTATGRGGAEALREMGAALQVIRMGTGSSEQAATAFEAVLRTLTDPAKIKQLRRLGVDVFDPAAMKEGLQKLRPINELMTEIVARSKGKVTTLGSIFDAEAMRSFNKAITDYQTTGEQANLNKFMQVQADGTTTVSDAARAAGSAAAALTYLQTSLTRFADNQLADDISSLADAVNKLNPDTVESILKAVVLGVGSLMAYSVGAKVYRGGRRLLGFSADIASPKGRGGRLAKLGGSIGRYGGKALSVASKAAVPLAVAGGAYSAYNIVTDDSMSTRDKAVAGSELAGGMAGGALGMKLGAAIGTAILPGIGTAIGAALGGLGGYVAGEWAGGEAAESVTGEPLQGELKITIDNQGRAQVQKLESNNRLALDVDTGMSMGVVG